MTREDAKRIIEVLLFASERPLSLDNMHEVLAKQDKAAIKAIIDELNDDYIKTGRTFSILEVGGGFQIMSDPVYAPWVRKLFSKDKRHRLSAPSLETLAIIAYRQPITRADIEAIRGVNIDGVLDTLLERELIRVAGRNDAPGRPFVYGTTKNFLTHFGLSSLESMPKLKEYTEEDIQLGKDELVKKESEEITDEPKEEGVKELTQENR